MSEVARLRLAEPDLQQHLSLPGWVYHDPEFFAVEMKRLIRPAWQIVCHASDIPSPGDWQTLDFLGESVIVMRGADDRIRAFANVCRHRGSRLVDGTGGCARRLTCPYHGWTYAADGRLIGVPHKEDYPGLDLADWGLLPVELEQWHGFLFVRLESGGPSVAEMMAPTRPKIAPYRLEELQAIGRITLRPRDVNWKNVADNYSDGLHIPVAHPGLTRLFGGDYGIEAGEQVDRMWGDLVERPSTNLSERTYQQLLPAEAGQALALFQIVAEHRLRPLSRPGRLHAFRAGQPDRDDDPRDQLRSPDAQIPENRRREMKAARYLNWRINRRVNAEDTALIRRVQQGMGSSLYRPGPLGASEVCLRSFATKLRRLIPEARLDRPPPPGWSGQQVAS